jgi:lysozyme family protein
MKKLRKWEGGLSNHLDDRGGKTFCGITKKYYPDWPGWKLVDTLTHTVDVKHTAALVDNFYYNEFWKKIKGDSLPNQAFADAMLSVSVNLGLDQATKLLQEMLRVTKDGVLGPETLKAVQNRGASKLFLQNFLDRVGRFYLDLVKKDPKNQIFLNGWQNRLADYTEK